MQPDIVIGGEFGAQNEARAEEEAQSIAAEPSPYSDQEEQAAEDAAAAEQSNNSNNDNDNDNDNDDDDDDGDDEDEPMLKTLLATSLHSTSGPARWRAHPLPLVRRRSGKRCSLTAGPLPSSW